MKKLSKYKIYGIRGIIKLFIYRLHTLICFRGGRMVRLPVEVRGKRYIDFGKELTTGKGCRIEAFPYFKESTIIQFGKNIEMNDYVHIAGIESVVIGDDVLIASKVYISDIQHGTYSGEHLHSHPDSIPKERELSSKPVIINDRVWIGDNVAIMPGVTIGEGCIIGANSVVTKDIPQFSIAVGSPAKVIKQFDFDNNKWVGV